MININGVELELDSFDADVSEKIQQELDRVLERNKHINANNRAQSIREQCHIIFDCFDNIFGEGTHKKIFGEKTNLLECVKAFEKFVVSIKEDDEKATKELEVMAKKYSPNRAQRRSK